MDKMDSLKTAAVFIVIIKSCNPNVALNKPTYASSIFPLNPPGKTDSSKAVDGSWSDSVEDIGCFATNHADMTPWWIVDLLDEYILHNVTIQNRANYSGCLHSFRIEVFSENPSRCPSAAGQRCLQYDGQFGSRETLTCTSTVAGRFVKISKYRMKSHRDTLTLCEVDLQAEPSYPKEGLWKRYPRTPGKMLTTSPSSTTYTFSLVDCARWCGSSTSCVAFNYRRDLQACTIITIPKSDNSVVVDAIYDYYGYDLC